MHRPAILSAVVGLVAGLLIGFAFADYLNNIQQTPNADRALPTVPGVPVTVQKPAGITTDVQGTLDDAKNNPDNSTAQLKAGEMYARIQRFDEALAYFRKAAALSPDSLDANAGLGRIYFEKKDYEQAEFYFRKSVGINGTDAGLRSDLGLTFYLREPPDLERAITEYRVALKIDPRHEATLQNLCVALKDLGNEEELAKTIEMLRNVNPKNGVLEKFKTK